MEKVVGAGPDEGNVNSYIGNVNDYLQVVGWYSGVMNTE